MVRMSEREFDAVLQGVIGELPDEFAAVLDEVPVIVDLRPSKEIAAEVEAPEELLGLFLGPSRAEIDALEGMPETSVILLFQRHLERECATRDELAEQIRVTLLHELGHFIGFDEDGLDRIGLG